MSIMQSLFFPQSKNFTFIASATSTAPTITIPASSQAGDFAVLFDSATNNSSTSPTTVVPSGWTSISNVADNSFNSNAAIRSIISYRFLVSGNPGSSITGMDGAASDRKIMMIFRPNFSIQSTSILSVNGKAYAPPSQTITISESLPPILAFAHWGSNLDASNRTISGITMIDIVNTTLQYASYAIFNPSDTTSNATVSMGTSDLFNSINSLQSFYVAFT